VTPSGRAAATCTDLRRTYRLDGSDVKALRGVDLTVPRGAFVALVGPSGSGKSTLLRLLACLDRPDSGGIDIDGTPVATLSRHARTRMRRRKLGFLFQAPADNLLPYLTVRQHLRLAAQLRGVPSKDGQTEALLDRLRLTNRADHLPRQLSGGEQQRAAVGFAAFGPPALLLADEPTGQLDHGSADSVLDAFLSMTEMGLAVVAATHDPAVAGRAHQILRLRDGSVEESP
jgi:putative ABC transport system ATP-binding protein